MNCSNDCLAILGVFLALFFHGFFSLCRSALIRARSAALKQEPHLGKLAAERARLLLASAGYNINLAQTGSVFCIGLAFVFSSLLVNADSFAVYFILLLLMFGVVSILGVVSSSVQRGFAYHDPNLTLRMVSYPFYWFSVPLIPIAYIATKINHFLSRFGLKVPKERDVAVSQEQLAEMVEESSEAGEIQDEAREMIEGVLELGETRVEEVMTPRQDIISLPINSEVSKAVDLFISSMHSRILVYGKNIDDVKGVLIAKDFLPLVGKSELPTLSGFVREVKNVSGDKAVSELLKEFKIEGNHFAVVIDEHGGVDGIITLEDLIEELVGDIYDEHDLLNEDQDFTTTSSGELVVDGGALVDDLNSEYDLKIPNGEYDTIAGFVIDYLGYIPDCGETFSYNGHSIVVQQLDDNRIVQVLIRPTAAN